VRRRYLSATRLGITIFWLLALTPEAQGSKFAVGPEAPEARDCASTQQTGNPLADQAMPFELGSGFLIVVEGRIGTLTSLRFALDTGATHSMMDAKIAARLRLARKEGLVLNFDRDVQVSWTNVPELQVGPLTLRDVRMMVGELQQLTEFAEGIDGVIGMDVLRMSRRMTINFETMRVTFRTDSRSQQLASGLSQAFLIRLQAQGEPLRLVLDTGARDIFLFEDRIRSHTKSLEWKQHVSNARAGTMKGKITQRLRLRLGTTELKDSAFLMERAPSSLPAEIDGYLGLSVLNARYVELDFEAGMLKYIEKEQDANVRAGGDENGRGTSRVETLAHVCCPF
jgi:predicted aspartyl protease